MGSGVLNVLAKTTGAVGLGLVLYDAHNAGKIKAPMEAKNHKSEQLQERYIDDMKLDKPSVVKAEAKHHIFRFFLDESFSEFFVSAKGYCKGFGEMLGSHVLPFALAMGTFVGSNGIRGGVSKFCGAGLLLYGGMFLAEEFLGVGKSE